MSAGLIIEQSAFDEYRDEEIQPGENVKTDEEIDAFVRQAVESAYHPSCSCKMGIDEMSVVGPDTHVHDIESLRVVDIFDISNDSEWQLECANGDVGGACGRYYQRAGMLVEDNSPVGVAENWRTEQC